MLLYGTVQRLRLTPDVVQLTDHLDVVSFRDYESELAISRRESSVDPTDPTQVLIEGRDNIKDLGEWLAARHTEGPKQDETVFAEKNEPQKRVSAIAVYMPFEEIRPGEMDDLTVVQLELFRFSREFGRMPLGRRIADSGLDIPGKFHPLIFAEHTADKLKLFPATFARIPLDDAAKMGRWILDGVASLAKKSIWS